MKKIFRFLAIVLLMVIMGCSGGGDSSSRGNSGTVVIPVNNLLAAADYHSIAVKDDGTVWAWGNNHVGQLGDGSTVDSTVPIKVVDLTEVASVSAGGAFGIIDFSLALKKDGTVWAWGSNQSGQLGNGTNINSSRPVLVSGLPETIKICAGSSHVVILAKDGSVWAWGNNGDGQLGNGTRTSSNIPVKVQGLGNVVDIAAGGSRTLVLKSNGTVMEWGDESGGSSKPIPPTSVKGLTSIVGIFAGVVHRLALKSDGTVWAWGSGYAGDLGDGTGFDSDTPVQVINLSGVVTLNTGVGDHNFAIKADNTVWGWGRNDMGQLGIGDLLNAYSPVSLTSIGSLTAITVGEFHTLASKEDGTVWSWGLNRYGELGNGTKNDAKEPVQIIGFNLNTI